MGEERGENQREQLAQRLKSLEDRLKERKSSDPRASSSGPANPKLGLAMKLSTEFIVSIAVGAGLGYMVDRYLEVKPWGMVIFLIIGFAAAVLNMLREVGLVSKPDIMLAPQDRKSRAGSQDDKDK